MEIDEVEILQLELKYCEYCGGLWLRRKGDGEVYCAACVAYVAQFDAPDQRQSRPHRPENARICGEGEDGEFVICSEGGHA